MAPVSPRPGDWTGIRWSKLAGQSAILAYDPDATDPPEGMSDSGWLVFGWSRGYVAFDEVFTYIDDDHWSQVTYTSSSTDGLNWTPGSKIARAGGNEDWPAGTETIEDVVEGPAGLLVVKSAGDCGPLSMWPFAVSRDGVAWRHVATDVFGRQVSAGAAGYIVGGAKGIFTSTDGLAWKAIDLRLPASKGLALVESAAAFGGGFVVTGEATAETGCVGSESTFGDPSLWWSPDGRTWTRADVPRLPAETDMPMYVCRYGDHLLVAGTYAFEQYHEWWSGDGRTWKRLTANVGVTLCPRDDVVLTVGGRTLITPHSGTEIYELRDDMVVTMLEQTGDLPPEGSYYALLGPAGLIATDDSGNTYVGVLMAR